MITLERDILLVSILVSYEIDRARVLAQKIHDSAIHIQTLFSFPILIHSLCNEAGVCVSLHLDPHVEALCTMYPSLIKADENPVALQRAASPPIPDPFSLEPQT